MTEQAPVDRSLAQQLLSELEFVQLRVEGASSLVGADLTDPGALDWSASATLSLSPENDSATWHRNDETYLRADTSSPGSGREFVILEASGLLIDLQHVDDIVDALDARSADYARFIPLFGDRDQFGFVQLCDQLEDSIESIGQQVVIVDRVRLAPAWRGLGGVGRLLTARLLRWVSTDPRIIAVQPFPIDLTMEERQNPKVFEPAMKKIRKTWKSLGFRPVDDEIWVMDPALNQHNEASKKLQRKLVDNR